MKTIITSMTLSFIIAFVPAISNAEISNSHSVDSIVNAIKTPIPEIMIKQSRELDDSLMRGGKEPGSGNKLYLITDERSTRASQIVSKLLMAMGEKDSDWVVRVFDTEPKVQNAFVMGGKYIYIFTGLLDEAGEDELAFILSHEIGHSFLKHYLRKKSDTVNSTLTGLAVLVAAISNKHRDAANAFGKTIGTSYSRIDEEEADAFGVATAKRAGFNPIHGADFFVRMERQQDKMQAEIKQKQEEAIKQFNQAIENAQIETNNAQTLCLQWQQKYKSALWRSQKLADNVNAACQDANSKVNGYNQLVNQKNSFVIQQQNYSNMQRINQTSLSTHPSNQNRVAAISALVDFLDGRRDIESLSKFEQSYRVMQALQQTNNIVMQSPVATAMDKAATAAHAVEVTTKSGGGNLQEQLGQLAEARKLGLITNKEYEKKRQQVLDKF